MYTLKTILPGLSIFVHFVPAKCNMEIKYEKDSASCHILLFWFPRKFIAGENRFYNAVSLMLTRYENLYHLLQALYSAELCLFPDFYASHPHFITILAKERTSGLLETIFSLSITFQGSDQFDKSLQNYTGCVKLQLNSQSRRWSPSTYIMA